MFQSKLFLRLFLTYMLVIFFYLFLCVIFLFYENRQISEMQTKRESEIQLDEVSNILEQRIMTARNIVQNLNYSTTMKQLYINERTGGQLDSYALFSIQSEMSSTMAVAGRAIYQTILFVDGSNKAYSSAGVITLTKSPDLLEQELPWMTMGTVNEVFGLNSAKRLSFNTEYLLYCDTYSYQTGSDIGIMCILFDLKSLKSDIEAVLGEGYGARITYGGQVIFSSEEIEDNCYVVESDRMPGLLYEICGKGTIGSDVSRHFYITLAGIAFISAIFVTLAYGVSKRYYIPIDHLEKMVSPERDSSEDEMEKIIRGIQNLIGEKNEYREKMLTITPYAKTGMLHSMIAGNVAAENVGVFLDEDLVELLRYYKENDMNDNGDKSDEIPLSIQAGMLPYMFGPAFGLDLVSGFQADESGNVTYAAADTDKYKAYLEFLHDLYKEELLEVEYTSLDRDQVITRISNDLTGVTFDFSWSMSMQFSSVLPYYDGTKENAFVGAAPLNGQYDGYYVGRVELGNMFGVNSSSSNIALEQRLWMISTAISMG